MGETPLSKSINDALESLGHVVVRVHSGTVRVLPPGGKGRPYWMQLAIKGTPDRVCLSPNGLTTWLEVKTATGRLSPDQKRWHERAKKGGHRVAVVRSVSEALAAVQGHVETASDGVTLARKRAALARYDEARLLADENGLVIGPRTG